jgi:lipid-A-disaccharide synthase
LTIFPFEAEMYKQAGIDVEFVGHPLLTQIPPRTSKNVFFKENELDLNKKLVSIFPGSRVFEISTLLKLFLDSAVLIKEKYPNVQFCLAQAPNIKDELINPILKEYPNLNIKVLKNKNYELLSSSDVLMLASGTVALEAAIYNTPMIISYRGPWFLYFIYLLVRSIKRVSLPNIIMDSDIVPELVQTKAKSNIIADNILTLLTDDEKRNEMINSLINVKEKLQNSHSAQNVAKCINNNI